MAGSVSHRAPGTAFNKNNAIKPSNMNTLNSTNTTSLSQRANINAKSQRDNQTLNSKTIDSDSNSTFDKYNLTTEGNTSGNMNKRLTLFSAGDAMASIEKIAKQHLAGQNARNKASKSPISGTKSSNASDRSISPSMKQQIEKIESIKKVKS